MGLKAGTRLTVFSVRRDKRTGATYWVKAGMGWVNKDESVNVYLDVLPIEGTLHCREAVADKREAVTVPPGTPAEVATGMVAAMEGHP